MDEMVEKAPVGRPEFDRPPVREVALSVTFEPLGLDAYGLAEVGRLAFSEEFPLVEVRPGSPPPVGPVGAAGQQVAAFSFTVGQQLGVPVRYWFRSTDGTKLVQLQSDFLAVNWQDVPGTEPTYPRFQEGTRPLLVASLDGLQKALGRNLVPIQAEVTYVNHIRPTGWSSLGEVDRVLRLVQPVDSFLGSPEGLEIAARYPLRSDNGETVGMLNMTCVPTLSADGSGPVIVETLTAVGGPSEPTQEALMEFLDVAHRWVVHGFVALSTAEALQGWGQES